ncbi:hypothetical protein OXPF_00080 [Oxobacter pfennigii]|uniref:Uncharacterized protein n=1 Tax=Oxobacter pfennigii TaxID=36849 RepID=A0A0P8WE15_9CLOT|nr:hypothetical protein [Oxobacter pfennigii]KPU46366.1 hypothetical protein OXPF_00080 [Oxobacter pfennigii]
MNKKRILGITILAIFLLILLLIMQNVNQSPYDFLKSRKGSSRSENATEFLYQADIGNKEYAVFYVNENGHAACAIIRRGIFTYSLLRISSEVFLNEPGAFFHFSSYNKGRNWIYWGIIQDENVKKVLINKTEANLVDAVYNFRICYLMGAGKEEPPQPELIY